MVEIVLAAKTLWDTLDPTLFPDGVRPKLYVGEVTTTAGLTLPHCTLTVEESDPEYQSDYGGKETCRLHLEFFTADLYPAQQIVSAVKWNGRPPANRAGFDFGDLALGAPYYPLSLVRDAAQCERVSGTGIDAEIVYRASMSYHAVAGIDPAAPPA